MKRRPDLLRHWDAAVAALIAVEIVILAPDKLANTFASAVYEMGISVLSIIFSVFFAALAVVMAAGDDRFVLFLREQGFYDKIVNQFRHTLWLLFGALIYSIVVFCVTAGLQAAKVDKQPVWIFVVFSSLFAYALLAAALAVGSSLRYARSRLSFLEATKDKGEGQNRPPEGSA